MKISYFSNANIEDFEKENFRRNLIFDNIHRGKFLAKAIIGFELILVISDICTSLLKVDNRFHYNGYFIMYSFMIVINSIFLLFIKKFEKSVNTSNEQLNIMEKVNIVYLTLIMSWGSVISMMDQKLYGQIIVFMVIMITSSVLFFLDHKKILVPYFFSILLIVIGLPFVQDKRDILIGHYINLCIFVIISWLASRVIFMSYVKDFKNNILLQKSKTLLEKEIEENKEINNKLAIANLQLKRLALVDELTGIPNRRGFKNYINTVFENYGKENSVLSIIMIDIDFFKQFNDNYGHDEGDNVLITVANQINLIPKNTCEYFVRWGGEEFIYLVLNSVEKEIEKLAEEIRRKVYELKIPNNFPNANDYLTVSIGTCTIKVTGRDDISKVINNADKALYLAKNKGRNCVESIRCD